MVSKSSYPKQKKHDIKKFGIKQINLNSPAENDVIGKYSERDLNRMGNENLDLLVNFSESPIKGELLGIPFHGVISFQYGDMANHKKGPPGFWEVFKREKSTSFYIQSNHDNLGEENKILLKGSIPTNFFFSLVLWFLFSFFRRFLFFLLIKNNLLFQGF